MSQGSKPEKTIEDYRRDIKLLKLKYLKIQEEKQKLEQTVQKLALQSQGIGGGGLDQYDLGTQSAAPVQNNLPPSTKTQSNYMNYDKTVMKEFALRCKQVLGMSPESVFRAADIEGKGSVNDQQLKSFLQQSRLNLSPQYIQRIIQLADVSCTGIIKKENFYECLAAFQINQETNAPTGSSSSGNRTFVQRSLLKFAGNLVSQKISPHDCFSAMDQTGENSIGYDDLNSYIAKYCKDMNDTECIGTFNYLDIDKEQRISRDMFVVELKKIMRVISKEKNIDVNDFIDSRSNLPPRQPQANSNRKNSSGPKQPQGSLSGASPEEFTGAVAVTMRSLSGKESTEIMNKITQIYKIDLQVFIDTLITGSSHPTAGIFLSDFISTFDKLKIGRKVPNELKLNFFRIIDSGNNGSIDYEELLGFYVENKTEQHPIELVYKFVALVLMTLKIKAEEAFTFISINSDKVLNAKEFKVVSEKIFFISKPQLTDKLFKELTGNTGQLSVKDLIVSIDKQIDELNQYDSLNNSTSIRKSSGSMKRSGGKKNTFKDLKNSQTSLNESGSKKPPSANQINSRALSSIETDINEYEKIMDEIYPDFDIEKDFFERVDKKDDGEVVFTKWKTILNDELPTLKLVLDYVKELKPGEFWSDPEFGPTESDPYGASSMYFSDNDIPSGCPPPENVTWMRIQEYLDLYLENNPEENEKISDSTDAMFLFSGASANDVKQSSYLGDCWFVSALSILAQQDSYLIGTFDPTDKDVSQEKFLTQMSEGVYSPMFHFLEKYGIFVIKFYKNFEWRYVIIDDKIPCLDGKIIYSHCRTPNEFWVALIEKAYAKIHNCYQALTSGDIGQGLTDLTGQVSMKSRFDHLRPSKDQLESGEFDKSGLMINGIKEPCNEDTYDDVFQKIVKERDSFWEVLKGCVNDGTLMGCSADGGTESSITYNDEKAGIYSGHAYSLINVFELKYLPEDKEKHSDNLHQNSRLLFLRNPWGFGEWLLKWSETEEVDNRKIDRYLDSIKNCFDEKIAKALKEGKEAPEIYQPGTDDGMFIMSYKDWRNIFSNLFVCFNFDPNIWIGYEIEDKWTKGFCSGTVKKDKDSQINFAMKNPQFTFQLKKKQAKPVEVFINLVQDDGRLYDGAKYPYENVSQSLLLCLFVLEPGKKKLEKFDSKLMIYSSGKFNLRREVDLGKLIQIEPDKTYCLIPCTMKGEEAFDEFKDIDFSINFYFSNCPESDITITKVNGEGPLKKDRVNVQAVDPHIAQNSAKLKNFLKSSVQQQIQ